MQSSFMLHNGMQLHVQRRNLPPKSKHAHILENVNPLQLYRMSQVSQNRCVGGDAALSHVARSTAHLLLLLLLLSVSHLPCCLWPCGTAVPPPAHTGGPAAAATAAAAATGRWARRTHLTNKHSSGFTCFSPFATRKLLITFIGNTAGG